MARCLPARYGVRRGLPPSAAVLIGVINAVGGGLLRDVLTREEPLVFKPGQFYLLTALAGAVTFLCAGVYLAITATQAALLASASAHWLRHTAGSHMTDQQVDLRYVRDNFGHQSISTTSGYLHSEEDARHEATQARHRIGWAHES